MAIPSNFNFVSVPSTSTGQASDSGISEGDHRKRLKLENNHGFDTELWPKRKQERQICLTACQNCDLIIFNLFCLEGFSIAEYYGKPSFSISPFFHQMEKPPEGFREQFENSYPELYDSMRNVENRGKVSWKHVEHWIWRIYLSDFGKWREELGLNPIPFLENIPLPLAPKLFYIVSKHLFKPTTVTWPDEIQMIGFVRPMHLDPGKQLPIEIHDFIWKGKEKEEPKKGLVFFGFGSMEEIGMIDHAANSNLTNLPNQDANFLFLNSVVVALQSVQMRGIWITSNLKFYQAWQGGKSKFESVLYCYYGFVPHELVFNSVSLIFHHGGAGTVAAAIRARCPQAIIPFIFDQHQLAEKISELGIGTHLKPLKSYFQEFQNQPIRSEYPLLKNEKQVSNLLLKAAEWKAKQKEKEIETKESRAQDEKSEISNTEPIRMIPDLMMAIVNSVQKMNETEKELKKNIEEMAILLENENPEEIIIQTIFELLNK